MTSEESTNSKRKAAGREFGQGARALFFIGAATATGFGVHAARSVLLPVIFGFLFAAAAQPLVKFGDRKGMPPMLSVALGLFGMLLVFVAASGTLVLGILDLAADYDSYDAAVRDVRTAITRFFGRHGFQQIALLVHRQDLFAVDASDVGRLLDLSFSMLGFMFFTALVAFFALLERASLSDRLAGSSDAAETWARVLSDTQRYLAIKAATSAVTGVLAAGICAVAQVPNAGMWGAVAFWLNFVPVVGSIAAGIPPFVIALVTQSPSVALMVALGYLLVNVTIGNFLEPRWQGRAAGISPLVVLLSIALWSGLLGTMAALVAVPLTMVVKIGCYHTHDLFWVARLLDDKSPTEPTDLDDDERDSTSRKSMFT